MEKKKWRKKWLRTNLEGVAPKPSQRFWDFGRSCDVSVADIMSATETSHTHTLLILFPVKCTEKICVQSGRLGANFFVP